MSWFCRLCAVMMGISAFLLMVEGNVLTAQSELQSPAVIAEIRVEGTLRVDPATVRSLLVVDIGDPFDAVRVNESLKKLYSSGQFSDVSISREDQTLIISVVENPVINQVSFENNDEIDDETLEQETKLKPRDVYTRSRVRADVNRMLQLYRTEGLYTATVEPKIIQRDQNRVDLVFEINEGKEALIRRVVFVGNRNFSDSKLRGEIISSEAAWWAIFRVTDKYDPDRLAVDRELLRRFYLREGYADFHALSTVAELSQDKENFYVTFTLEEGERYKFGRATVEVMGMRDVDRQMLKEAISHEIDAWYDAEQVEVSVQNLTDVMGNFGYAFAEVQPKVQKDEDKRLINLTYEIGEGEKVFVERIDIVGNVRTEDQVIRREFRLVEGDAFNAAKVRRSRQRIQNLGYFSKVGVETKEGETPDRTVVEVEVEEKTTGELSLGLSYSTSDSIGGDVTIRENNLLGRGQKVRLSFSGSLKTQQVDFGFTEPYFLGRPLAAGFDVFRTKRNRQSEGSFSQKELGLRLRTGYEISEFLSQSWRYSLTNSEVIDVAANASAYVKAAAGGELRSSIGQTLLYDKRDNRFMPNDGYYGRLSSDFVGLGGSVRNLRGIFDTGFYVPLLEEVVLGFNGELGYITGLGKKVKLLDRFFLGGSSLRGFRTSGVGPRDVKTDDALGGKRYWTGRAQLRFPLGLPEELGVSGRAFTDVGSLFRSPEKGKNIKSDSSMRLASGLGVGWISPFGLINVDYAFPLIRESYDKVQRFRLSFGTNF